MHYLARLPIYLITLYLLLSNLLFNFTRAETNNNFLALDTSEYYRSEKILMDLNFDGTSEEVFWGKTGPYDWLTWQDSLTQKVLGNIQVLPFGSSSAITNITSIKTSPDYITLLITYRCGQTGVGITRRDTKLFSLNLKISDLTKFSLQDLGYIYFMQQNATNAILQKNLQFTLYSNPQHQIGLSLHDQTIARGFLFDPSLGKWQEYAEWFHPPYKILQL